MLMTKLEDDYKSKIVEFREILTLSEAKAKEFE